MWNLANAKQCLTAFGGKPRRVLIVGCGDKGEDVKAFNELLGQSEVEIHGVDVVDTIGRSYQADNVLYIKSDVTSLPFRSQYYDLAYSFATFEHVANPGAGWQNMLDALRPGGMLWCVSSPLWMSPYGHHKKDILLGHPWAHLRCPTVDELSAYCETECIKSKDMTPIRSHIAYMLNERFFNKLPPEAYWSAANELINCELIKNSFDLLKPDELRGQEWLFDLGYKPEQVLAQTHRLAARRA